MSFLNHTLINNYWYYNFNLRVVIATGVTHFIKKITLFTDFRISHFLTKKPWYFSSRPRLFSVRVKDIISDGYFHAADK